MAHVDLALDAVPIADTASAADVSIPDRIQVINAAIVLELSGLIGGFLAAGRCEWHEAVRQGARYYDGTEVLHGRLPSLRIQYALLIRRRKQPGSFPSSHAIQGRQMFTRPLTNNSF